MSRNLQLPSLSSVPSVSSLPPVPPVINKSVEIKPLEMKQLPPLPPVITKLTTPSALPSLPPVISATLPQTTPVANQPIYKLPPVLQTAVLPVIKTQPTLSIPSSIKSMPSLPTIRLPPPSSNLLTTLPIQTTVNQTKVNQPTVQQVQQIPPVVYPNTKVQTKSQTSPIEKQYTRELQLAPLSTGLDKIIRTRDPTIIVHSSSGPSFGKDLIKKEKTEQCCVCYNDVQNMLVCRHSVCADCMSHLQAPECPICKKILEGPVVTDDLLTGILDKQEQARMKEQNANYLASVYLQENPDADMNEIYQFYQDN